VSAELTERGVRNIPDAIRNSGLNNNLAQKKQTLIILSKETFIKTKPSGFPPSRE
jgi:hypothetical protein